MFQLVKTELHILIDHTMIADAAFIRIYITFIIWDVVPQRSLVLWFQRSHIQASKIRSRGKVLLSSDMLYDYHHTGKYQQFPFHVFIYTRFSDLKLPTRFILALQAGQSTEQKISAILYI